MGEDAKVSCLMVTASDPRRLDPLKLSIQAYLRQTYANRELVVLVNDDGAALDAIDRHVGALARPDIRVMPTPGTHTLGQLRNLSVAAARGDIICQWDDDDLFHPRRLELHLGALIAHGGPSMFLSETLLFFRSTRALHALNWTATPAQALASTLMCWRRAVPQYPERGPTAERSEDLAVLEALRAHGGFAALGGHAHLHVYVAHGANTWPSDFHRMLASELSISCGLLKRREEGLRAELADIDFGPGAVNVVGANGLAFVLDRA